MGVLRSRLYEQELAKKEAGYKNVLSGKFWWPFGKRTYNYAQGTCDDHRVGLTLYDLGNIMNGDIQNCWWTSIS
jgi:peptide chain release factor 1